MSVRARKSSDTGSTGRNGQSGLIWWGRVCFHSSSKHTTAAAAEPAALRSTLAGTGWPVLTLGSWRTPAGWRKPGREMDLGLGAMLGQKAWRGTQKSSGSLDPHPLLWGLQVKQDWPASSSGTPQLPKFSPGAPISDWTARAPPGSRYDVRKTL